MHRGLIGAVAVLMGSAAAVAQQPETEEVPSYAQPVPEMEPTDRIAQPAPSEEGGLDWSVMAGGGFEGYTGGLSAPLQIGPAWGATFAVTPFRFMGAELSYTGATHEFDLNTDVSGGAGDGADIVRNGGHIAGTFGYEISNVRPYLLAGVGINNYNVRNPIPGFSDDTNGYVPLAGGVQYQMGAFTADARFGFNVLFANDLGFDPATLNNLNGTYYDGMLRLGATF